MAESKKYEISIAAETHYLADQSDPQDGRYVFAYNITIRNTGTIPAQLISRHWIITDAESHVQEVRGLGVVGHQPLLKPGESFEYTSGCILTTPVGTMRGSYQMTAEDGTLFEASIAAFTLAMPRVRHSLRRSGLARDRPQHRQQAGSYIRPRPHFAPTLFSYRSWRCDNAFTVTTNRHHGADLRKGRFSELGRIYLVTAVTRGRSPFFCDLLAARTLIRELLACDETGLTKTWAFVVMPDHLHWLVELGTGHLSSAVRRVKSNSAIRLNRLTGAAVRPVWQRGFHDHALRHEEDLRETARYVVANPVRAGLAESVHGYPHWDAAWL